MIKKTCTRCRWHNNNFVNCVGFFGNPKAEIVFCGEAFGRNEALVGEAFVGDAGGILDDLLIYASLKREDIAIMNAMRCYLEGNPTPSKKELDSCFIFSYRDIQKINPKLVVAMGGAALYQLTGKEGIERYKGKLLWSDKINKKVFATNHPAVVLYDRAKLKDLKRDFKNIPKLLNEEVQKVKHFNYKYAEDYDTAIDLLSTFETPDNELYFDLESTGLNPFKKEITLLQLGNKNSEVIIIDGKILDTVKDRLLSLFENCDIIGQNYSFDTTFLFMKLGIFPKKWKHDTCLAEFLIFGMKDNDLNYLTYKYYPDSFGYDDLVIDAGGAHKVRDKKVLLQYACDDVGVLPFIKEKQRKVMLDNDQLWFFENLLMPCNKVLTKMSIRGVTYDIRELDKFDNYYSSKAEALLNSVLQLDGIKEYEKRFKKKFNPRSHEMISWLLLDYYKLPPLKKTKTKQKPSLGKKEMEKYAKEYDNEYCKTMEKYRSFQNIRDNFLFGVKPKLIENVAHTTYSLHAAATGRPNSKDPNLLNIPPEIRSIVVPRKGYLFLHADLSQIEIKVAAVVYNDDNLIKISNDTTKDFHSMIAARTFKYDYDTFYKKYKEGDTHIISLRRAAKGISFGVLYQETAWGLAYELGITEEEAQRFIDDYFTEFPQLRENIEKTKEFVIKHGYIRNPFGFIRKWKYHSYGDAQTLRECVNQPIQSLAWNLMELILIQTDTFLENKKSKLVLQTYDDMVIEVYKTEIDEVAKKVKSIIDNVNKPFGNIGLDRVNISADIELGENLGEFEKYL
jgi:DNA polymerase I